MIKYTKLQILTKERLETERDFHGSDPQFGFNKICWFITNVHETLLNLLVCGHRAINVTLQTIITQSI